MRRSLKFVVPQISCLYHVAYHVSPQIDHKIARNVTISWFFYTIWMAIEAIAPAALAWGTKMGSCEMQLVTGFREGQKGIPITSQHMFVCDESDMGMGQNPIPL